MMVPGMHPGFIASQTLTTLQLVHREYRSGRANDLRLTWPTVQPGDVAIINQRYDEVSGSGPPGENQPDGFTSVAGASDFAFSERVQTGYRLCDGTESGTLTSGGLTDNSNDDRRDVSLLIFRGNAPVTDVVVSLAGFYMSNGNPPGQTATADVVPYIVFSIQRFDFLGDSAPGGSVDAADLTYSQAWTDGDITEREWVKIFNEAPADWSNNRNAGSESRAHNVTTIKILCT